MMNLRRTTVASLVCLTAASASLDAQQRPRFQTSVEVTSIDVGVVDDSGRPIKNLGPQDFVVKIDGNTRPVVSAQWISLASEGDASPAVTVPTGYSSNENSTAGRLIVIAVDQPNIRFGGARGLMAAVNAFVDKLSPSDRIAAVGFGIGGQATAFTDDRGRVKQAISRMVGQRQMTMMTDHNIALSEALNISRGYPGSLDNVLRRECERLTGIQLEICVAQVQAEAESMARDSQEEGDLTIRGLRDLLSGLRTVDAPKTLVLVSEGFVMENQAEVTELGSMAAAARTSIYVLKLDEQLYEAMNAKIPIAPFEDRRVRAEGLEQLAASARGAMFTVVGTGAALFQRIESEISGYYLLGVESDPKDHDGKAHPVRVEVPRRGAYVRSRRQMLNVAADRRARAPQAAVAAALSTPLLMSALPIRVATFGLQGPERGKVQLLIHADVGSDYTSLRPVSVGYLILDREGRLVHSQAGDARIGPAMNGVPSPLQYSGGASLPPGEYTLKLAVAEGDRVGSVQHEFRAGLSESNGVTFSELMAGGPADMSPRLQPTVNYTVSFGVVHGYVEAYGPGLDSLRVKYEVAADPDAPALVSGDVQGMLAGDTRALFTKTMPLPSLPPGKYVLRAIVTRESEPLKTLTRPFEIAPPAVLMTSAENGGVAAASLTELFLPVEEDHLATTFRREEAIHPETLQPFRELLDPNAREAFEKGIVAYTAGDYTQAALSFKTVIQPEIDSTAQLVYLAACLAAMGRDHDAAGAWQTALVDGGDHPQIYAWLGETLMRTHDLGVARTLFEEAVAKWPTDARFIRPLAMLYATFGQGRDAVRTLERYLADHPDDRDAAYLGVEWIYTIHVSGALVHTRAEDLRLAHAYGEAYQKAGGPKAALVRQWLDYLDKEKR